jgi:hypothetical protein
MDCGIGTWNVRTLLKAAALRTFTQQLFAYEVKTGWTGEEIWTQSYTLLYLVAGKSGKARKQEWRS